MANGSNTNAGAVANPTYTTKSVPESDYLAPARVNDLNRKLSDTSQRSEADSLLDLYKSAPTKRAAPTGVENGGKRKQTNGFGKPTGHEEDAWIHRDKLAQIESRELEEAGFKVPSASRSVSRSASRSVSRSASRSHSNSVDKRHEAREVEDFHDADVFRRDEIMQHTLPEDALDESMEDEDVDMMDWELRTPEEVAAEQWEMSSPVAKPPPRQPGSRSSDDEARRAIVISSGPGFTNRKEPEDKRKLRRKCHPGTTLTQPQCWQPHLTGQRRECKTAHADSIECAKQRKRFAPQKSKGPPQGPWPERHAQTQRHSQQPSYQTTASIATKARLVTQAARHQLWHSASVDEPSSRRRSAVDRVNVQARSSPSARPANAPYAC